MNDKVTIEATGILAIDVGEELQDTGALQVKFGSSSEILTRMMSTGDKVTTFGVEAVVEAFAAGLVSIMFEARREGLFTNQQTMDMLKASINKLGSRKVTRAKLVREIKTAMAPGPSEN